MERRPRLSPPAFSCVELLFAVGVLSAGMIGVAAALYVGVDQTRTSLDDSVAAALARQAAATLGQTMTDANTPPSGTAFQPFSFAHALEQSTRGEQLCTTDPRYAWIPLYRRAVDSRVAELILIIVRAESRTAFDAADLVAGPNPTYPPTLEACRATVRLADHQVEIDSPAGADRVAPGAVLVLRTMSDPSLDGRILRVGGPAVDGRWPLTPGQDLADFSAAAAGSALLVGRGYADVSHPDLGYAGGSQVVAVYGTMVLLR